MLRQALLSQKKAAIAKTVMGTNEKLLVLCPTKEGIIVKTLFYHDEIAAVPKKVPKVSLDKNKLDMAKMLVDNMTKPFVPEGFQYEYQARLRDAIMKKIQGKEVVTADISEPGNVIDLMEALQVRAMNLPSGFIRIRYALRNTCPTQKTHCSRLSSKGFRTDMIPEDID